MATTGEGNLDTQYAFSLSYPANGTYYNTGGLGSLVVDLDMPTQQDNQNEPYLDFLHYILALPDDQLPTTLSTSYGENEQSVPKPCMLAAVASSLFVSLLIS